MKPIEFMRHARKQMSERGANKAEVIEAIRTREQITARRGRHGHRMNFPYNQTMRISYDPEAAALYIRLTDEPAQVTTFRLSEDVALTCTSDGRLIGIEILMPPRTHLVVARTGKLCYEICRW